jgi:hypothetical protein
MSKSGVLLPQRDMTVCYDGHTENNKTPSPVVLLLPHLLLTTMISYCT